MHYFSRERQVGDIIWAKKAQENSVFYRGGLHSSVTEHFRAKILFDRCSNGLRRYTQPLFAGQCTAGQINNHNSMIFCILTYAQGLEGNTYIIFYIKTVVPRRLFFTALQ
jgi:hypothetical protein